MYTQAAISISTQAMTTMETARAGVIVEREIRGCFCFCFCGRRRDRWLFSALLIAKVHNNQHQCFVAAPGSCFVSSLIKKSQREEWVRES
jgi:hypothetical protein